MEVNYQAPADLIQGLVPHLITAGNGWIVNLTSAAARTTDGPPFAVSVEIGLYGATKAALNRLTVAAAGENEGKGIAINALTPQVAIVNAVGSALVPNSDLFEPVETMAEAALALCTGDPSVLTGRIAYSLQLLLELDRPVYNLTGEGLVDGWQPADLVAAIRVREKFHEGNNWPHAFDFHRVHTPYPAALQGGSPPAEG
jgi:NAD(P)-dependent dehydrogenase (short-subunit alcohol dehydrogenase family)